MSPVPYEGQVEVVVGTLIYHADTVLLIQSTKWGDHWLLPGGHVELGESVFQTAEREALEETKLPVTAEYIVGFGEDVFMPEYHRRAHMMYYHVVCRAEHPNVQMDANELKTFMWVTPQAALQRPLIAQVRKSIERFAGGIRLPFDSQLG